MENQQVLTTTQCQKIVSKHTKSSDFKITSFEVNPMKAQLEGLIGEQYIASINYETNDTEHKLQLFVKILNGNNKVMFELSKSINAYEKEAFFYEFIVQEFEAYNLDVDFVPKCYLCEPYMVVLEDLSLCSYRGTKKSEPLDFEHCKRCLETLARFHVNPIVYEERKSKELNKEYRLDLEHGTMLEDKLFSKEENGASRFLKCSVNGLFNLIDLVPENSISKEAFKEALRVVLDEILAASDGPSEFRSTILHGDLWSNNFMFKYENDKVVDSKLIDFQVLKYGPPGLDVLQFMLTNTRKSFRDNHQNELLKYYYNYFIALLIEKNLQPSEILTESEFMKSCQVFMLPAKLQAIVDRSITFMSDETFLVAAQTDESFSKFLFEERGNYIVNSFKCNKQFRELMIEDMLELKCLLFDEK